MLCVLVRYQTFNYFPLHIIGFQTLLFQKLINTILLVGPITLHGEFNKCMQVYYLQGRYFKRLNVY